MRRILTNLLLAFLAFTGLWEVRAADVVKANNSTQVNLDGSWVGGDDPDADDIAVWNSTLSTAGNLQMTFSGDVSWGGIRILNPVGNVTTTVGNAVVTLGSGGIDMTAATANLTLSRDIVLSAAQTWDVASGRTLTIALSSGDQTVVNGGFLLTIQGAGNTSIAEAISGTGGLTKNGGGTLTLSGANSYSGVTTISGGILQLGADNVLGNGAGFGNLVINTGGTFDLAGFSDTINGLSGSGIVDKTTGSSTETLTFGSGDASATFSGTIQDSDSDDDLNLVKTGTGTQTLSGNNTYEGTTSVNAGVLRVASSTALGDTSGNTSVANGAALELSGGVTIGAGESLSSLAGTGISNGGALRSVSGNNTWNGAITIADTPATTRINSDADTLTIGGVVNENGNAGKTLALGGAGNITITGNIDDNGGDLAMLKDGTGTVKLSGTSDSTLGTTLSGGVLWLNNASALFAGNLNINGGVLGLGVANFTRSLGTGSGAVQFTGSGGFAAYGAARNVNLGGASAGVTWASGNFVPNGSTLILGAGDADNTVTFQNPIALNGAARTVQANDGSASTDAVLSGVLSGTGSSGLTKTGTGTLQLTGANTYDGVTTVNAGILSVSSLANGGATSGIGDSSSAAGNLVLNGGTLQYTGGSASSDRQFTLGTSGGTIDTSGSGAFNFNATAAVTMSGTGTRTLTLTGNNTGNNILAAVVGNQSGNATTLVKDGAGKWILTGNNTYTGQTYINAGTLQVGNGGTSGTLGGTAAVNNNGALVVNRSDAITINNAITGNGSLTQAGTGTTTLGVANNYSGGTTLSGGTLKLGVDNAVGSGGMVFAGGTLDSNGRSFSIGALSMTADSTLDLLSTGSGSLTFASATASLGTTLTINNWVGTAEAEGGQQDRIFITANPGATFLSQVSFFGYDPGAVWMSETHELLPNGLTPVPEPTEWALIIFAVLAVFYKFVLPRLRRPALALAPVSRPVRS